MPPRTVLITGANSGVGYAASKVLASASPPYHVIMAGRSLSKLQAAQSEIHASAPSTRGNLSTVEMDVTSPSSIRAALATISSQHPHLDVLINNAATGNTDPDTYTRYHATLDTNVIGPAVVADTFRPFLLKSPNPYSIYVSSCVGSLSRADEVAQGKRAKMPEPANAQAYKASKAALNSIALQEYIEYKDQGLKVFAMCPGFVVSNLRGKSEEQRTGWGRAGPAEVSGETLLSIVEGKRDGDVGRFVHKDGVYGW